MTDLEWTDHTHCQPPEHGGCQHGNPDCPEIHPIETPPHIPGPAELVRTWREIGNSHGIEPPEARALLNCADELEEAMRHIGANMLAAHGITITHINDTEIAAHTTETTP